MNNVGCYTISGNMSNIDQIVGVANAHVGRSPPCLRHLSSTGSSGVLTPQEIRGLP